MENKKVEKRQSNFELLRIISMFFIIIFHYSFKGGFAFGPELTANKFIIKSFWMLGELGVNLFVLISGYFMIKSSFKIKKFLMLVLEVWFYNFALNQIAAYNNIGVGIERTFLPIITNAYWFITAYLLVYLLSPFLNKLANGMTKKEYSNFLILILVLFCVIPTVVGSLHNTTEDLLYYNRFIWMIIIYMVGGYIRLYSLEVIKNQKRSIILTVSMIALILFSIAFINRYPGLFNWIGITEVAYFWTPNSILLFLLSIGFFGMFLNLKIGYSRVINQIASTTLGIYLFHDGLFAPRMWSRFAAKAPMGDSLQFMGHILLSALIVFVMGYVVDSIRQLFEKFIVKKLLDTKCFNRFLDKIKLKWSKVVL